MKSFEQKSFDNFADIIINKSLIHSAGFGSVYPQIRRGMDYISL